MKDFGSGLKTGALLCFLLPLIPYSVYSAGDPVDGFDPNPDSAVSAIVVQPDGKILVGGSFTMISGVAKDRLARIDTDGSVETAFSAGATSGEVRSIALQPDGKILIGGNFSNFGGQPRQHIARVNPDGTLDMSFNPGVGTPVNHIAVQEDGKILVGGNFFSIGGEARSRIARLLTDGTVDPGFNPGANGEVHSILVQRDGKILVGGQFTTLGSEDRRNFGRLNSDGSADTSFDVPVTGTGSAVSDIVQRADGRIIIGGSFTSVAGSPNHHIAVLDEDGTLNAALAMGADAGVGALLLLRDGRLLIGGAFSQIDGHAAPFVARVNRDLTVDTGFNGSANSNVTTLTQQKDGNILASGPFSELGGVSRNGFGRIIESGAADDTFTVPADATVNALAFQEDGAVVIGGNFQNIDSTGRNRIARLDVDGVLDPTFDADVDGQVFAVVIQPDGKVIIGGVFDEVDSTERNGIARLNSDGSLDTSFNPDLGSNMNPGKSYTLLLLPNGKIIVGGSFTSVGAMDTPRDNIARLNSDGTLDSGFTSGTDGVVYALGYQSDGRILVGGNFLVAGGQLRDNIARLSPEGVADDFDPSATPGLGLPGGGSQVYALLQQPDGKILVGGLFEFIAGNSSPHLVRLNSNGSYDETFTPDIASTGPEYVSSLAQQSNGDVIVGGVFSSVGTETKNNLVRLNSFGDVDDGFDAGCDGAVNAVALQRDGKILVGGAFTTVGIESRTRIARLSNNLACSILAENASNTRLEWTRKGSAPVVDIVDFSISDDNGQTWIPLGSGTWSVTESAWQSDEFDLPVEQSILVRVRGRQVSNAGFHAGSSSHEEIAELYPLEVIVPPAVGTSPVAKAPPTALIRKLKKLKKKLKKFKKAGKRAQAKKLKGTIKRLKVQIAVLS